MIICSKCKADNPDGVRFCTSCGNPLQQAASQSPGQPAIPSLNGKAQSPSSITGQTILIQMIIVIAVCVVLSLVLSYIFVPLGSAVKGLLPQWTCTNEVVGSIEMYLCSMKIGLMAILPSIVIIVIVFVLRKPLNKLMESLAKKLPENTRFIVPPIMATLIFSLAWSWYHVDTSSSTGIMPNRIFPVFVGLFTYSAIQFGPKIQNAMASFFRSREKVPVFFRYILVLAIPMGIALLITNQERVTEEALKEQVVVIIALIAAYLLVSPLLEKQSAGAGLTPSSSGFAGRTAVMFLLAVSGGLLLRVLADTFLPGVALAHDCSSEGDCQQKSGPHQHRRHQLKPQTPYRRKHRLPGGCYQFSWHGSEGSLDGWLSKKMTLPKPEA